MQISYLADRPDLTVQLVSGLLEQWRFVFPNDTAATRLAKLRMHENYSDLPIAWIAHDADKALGTAALRVHDLEGREDLTPWLGGVFVQPEFRRRGVGSALCRAVEEKARAMGVARLYLFTLGQERLYATLGWVELEPTLWKGHAGTIMTKVPMPP